MWEAFDAQAVHGDDVGGRCGAGLAVAESGDEFGVVVGHVDADCEGAEDEKCREAVEHGVVGARHDFAGVFGFTGGHGDVVGSGDGERGLDEALQEAEEFAEFAFVVEVREGSGVLPVPEAVAVFFRVAAQHGDECED